MKFKNAENICVSGAAEGADTFWGDQALLYGHSVIHWSFDGHKYAATHNVYDLNQEELNKADPFLIEANKVVKRKFPTRSNYVNNLLRRNYYQICYSDSVYAVGYFEDGMVKGGTAWAVEMMKQKISDKNKQYFNGNCYFFEQNIEKWFFWDFSQSKWIEFSPPAPHGIYAAIGARDLLPSGMEAIKKIYLK